MNILKYIVGILIVFAILQQINIIRMAYVFFDINRQVAPIGMKLFLVIFIGSVLSMLIYIIFYLVSIVLIIKNKKTGYLFAGIDSLLIFGGSISHIVKNNIPVSFSFTTVMIFVFWVSIITLSFLVYLKMTKQSKNIGSMPHEDEFKMISG